jgi:hypothetical protein
MKSKNLRFLFIGLVAVLLLASATVALAGLYSPQRQDETLTLVETVREATEQFEDVAAAEAAGYALFHGCVSSPLEGAMGIHFANGALVGDGLLDAMHPEVLLYEFRNGGMRLLGVEYVVFADTWHEANQAPPVLMGQLFNYVGSPNRYGLPAFYELHVWAWQRNHLGTFADFNPRVSCEDYTAEADHHAQVH